MPEDYLRRDADHNTIPTFEVDYIVECPFGGHPTGMFGKYDVDGAFLKDFYGRTRTQEGFDAFAKVDLRARPHELPGEARLAAHARPARQHRPQLQTPQIEGERTYEQLRIA